MSIATCCECRAQAPAKASPGEWCRTCWRGIYVPQVGPGIKWPDTYIAGALLEWPQVTWDRFTEDPDGTVTVYGWIERSDGRADFVLMEFEPDFHQGSHPRDMTTSSPAFSAEWAKDEERHNECQRVERRFFQVWNAVRLVESNSGSAGVIPARPLEVGVRKLVDAARRVESIEYVEGGAPERPLLELIAELGAIAGAGDSTNAVASAR